ncbi:tetratricopeptide repeat protein [Pelagicoccus sp. SDUM812002]|uniref:tetratricopeptide repeat protein n=1 Tax=Pelagicoccus sp. SDUM812002 TaxID=3041266 RepID=UPI00280DDAB2|nr:tetratricopeptide repeat protein [Pelagicoccus sp. SDUM812002]MDQ8184226.1 tetratricopeptide repeat protein [Pelagicoccus sp. SDUM812002]
MLNPFPLRLQAVAARRKQELPRARRFLEKAIKVDPSHAHAHFQLGLLYLDLQDLESAKITIRKSVDLNPSYGDGWVQLIEFSQSQAEATRLFEEGLRKCPNSPTLHSLNGKRLKASGQLNEALEAFRKVASLRPAEILRLFECTLIQFQRGENDEANASLQKALEIVPEDPLVLYMLAIHWIKEDNEPNALDLARRCLAQTSLSEVHLSQV